MRVLRGIEGQARILVALLTVSIFINYIDRSNLSVGTPLIERDLHYSVQQIGWLSSGFFWTYSLLQFVGFSGWISDHFPVRRVFAAGFLLWSIATAASGLVVSFWSFFAMRLLLGAGESLAYPCYSRMIASDVPQVMRGRANALLDAGSKLGPGLGTLLGGFLLASYGWRAFFFALGIAGLLWLPMWIWWMRRTETRSMAVETTAASLRELLHFRSAWGAFAGHFCANYFWFFLLTWLPLYLVDERGLTMRRMGSLGSIAYFVIAGATLTAGWISDLLLQRGADVTRVRKCVVVTGLVVSTAILPVAFVHDLRWVLAWLYVSCAGFGTYTSNHWVITQTLAGPLMAGRWTSVQNGIGNFSGIVAAWLTALVVSRTGSFRVAFYVAAGVVLVAAGMWGLVVGPVREVPWSGLERARLNDELAA